MIQRRGAAHVVAQQVIEFATKVFLLQNVQVPGAKLFYVGIKHLRNISPAKAAVITAIVYCIFHSLLLFFSSCSNPMSFLPGAVSTPLFTSSAYRFNPSRAMALATFAGFSPPVRKTGSC